MQLYDVLYSEDVEVAGKHEQHGAHGGADEQTDDRQQVGCFTGRDDSVEDELGCHRGEHTEKDHHKGTCHEEQGIGA